MPPPHGGGIFLSLKELLKKHALSLVEGAASSVLGLRAHKLGALRAVRARKSHRTHLYASVSSLPRALPVEWCVLAHRSWAGENVAFLNSPLNVLSPKLAMGTLVARNHKNEDCWQRKEFLGNDPKDGSIEEPEAIPT